MTLSTVSITSNKFNVQQDGLISNVTFVSCFPLQIQKGIMKFTLYGWQYLQQLWLLKQCAGTVVELWM
jgi:hypothetical protein